MAPQTTSNLSNSLRVQYTGRYLDKAFAGRFYDQLAIPVPGITPADAIRGSSVQVEYLSGMTISGNAISQVTDVTPQILYDAVASVTPTSRGDALQWSENLDITVFTNYAMKRIDKIAENQTESVEALAIAAALAGSWVERATARASLDAGTPGHRASDAIFRKYQAKMQALRVPGWKDSMGQENWAALMRPEPFHDICESGNVDAVGVYQDMGIHLNFELAKIGPFRLLVSAFAKVFGAAGADNATSVATTLGAATTQLATSFTTGDDVSANVAVGEYWWIGTEETASTFYPTNEPVKPITASTTTISAFIGQAENGGLRFPHASGVAVRNADSVYPIVFGGPGSLVKLYDPGTGEYGEFVPPHEQGLLHQWTAAGWKFYGGYGRLTENMVLRGEYSTSFEA
jgi:hypothetical protein